MRQDKRQHPTTDPVELRRQQARLMALSEACTMKLAPAAHGALTIWRTGFACYMLLASGLTVEESEQRVVRVEWKPGRPV